MVNIIYCKISTILFTLNVTSILMMEVSVQFNSQAAVPLAVEHPISVGGKVCHSWSGQFREKQIC